MICISKPFQTFPDKFSRTVASMTALSIALTESEADYVRQNTFLYILSLRNIIRAGKDPELGRNRIVPFST
jgi:hypothetical protein